MQLALCVQRVQTLDTSHSTLSQTAASNKQYENAQTFLSALSSCSTLCVYQSCGAVLQVVDSACLSLYCGFDPTADSLHLGEAAAGRVRQQQGNRPDVTLLTDSPDA